MKRNFIKSALAIALFFSLAGCEHLMEPTKTLWGSSTRALEHARGDATVKTFLSGWEECFDKVLEIATENDLTVFVSDRHNLRIVLMGFSGSISTTEVGIFFSEGETGKTKLEIVSLSPDAQAAAAKLFSENLQKSFPEI